MNVEFKALGETFLSDIEALVVEKQLSHIDAIIHWCDIKKIEPEWISSMISNNLRLKSKIQIEAENLNFIPRSVRTSI